MPQEEFHRADQNPPAHEKMDAADPAGSPFQLYDADQAASSDTGRPGIPRPRPEGQASNFGTAGLRPELFKQQSHEAGAGNDTSPGIMEKIREAGKLATEGRLDSEKAAQIIEQIRVLGERRQEET